MKFFQTILFVLATSLVWGGQGSIEILDADKVYSVKDYEFFVDTSNAILFNEVKGESFKPITSKNYKELQNTNNIWIKINYNVGEFISQPVLMIDQANMDTVKLIQQNRDGIWKPTVYGNNFPFNTRKYKTNHFIFDLNNQDTSTVAYLCLKNNVKTSFNLFIGEQTVILESEQNGSTLFAVMMGVFLVMITYNLFIYFSVKEVVYLIYVIQSFLTALLQAVLFGFSFQYFWPNQVSFQEFGIEFITTIASMGGLIFMNLFLKLKKYSPALLKISYGFILVYGVLAIWVWFSVTTVNSILLTIQPLLAVFILVTAINVWGKGYTPAKYYLIAWVTFLIGILFYSLAELGFLPRNNFTILTITVGAGLEVVLLSFALANRINELKHEQEIAVAKSLNLEKEKANIIQAQNVTLEQKVKERTVLLAAKGQEIENAYSELKETQSQLVNSEKMSSLGQLTAGIAHEINNPINFVSANVSPLKRDINDLVSVFEQTEIIAKEGLTSEGYEKIEVLKREFDYDFLKLEINLLLNGMSDGANRTVEIVQGLKLFARVDEEDLKKVNLEEGMNATLILLNSKLKHQIKINIVFTNIPLVDCYGGKMNQVFMNVLSNAIDAIHSSNVIKGEISISTLREGNTIKISFKDNGQGMSEEVKNKLFEPFFTTKQVGEGTGLGLSIVYKIIEKHNGTIKVNSVVDKGTEFVITLPISNKTPPPTHV